MTTDGERPSKEICLRLAERLCEENGLETARLLQQTGVLEFRLNETADAGTTPEQRAQQILQKYVGETPAPIGIWSPQDTRDGVVFVRDDSAPTRAWWPPQKTLMPKKSHLPLRVCLLGESTAAGWFYAPAQTPALVLDDQLRQARPGIFEVLDLTMVNLQPNMLMELTAAALQLTPDLIVIFAGNNWPMRLPSYPNVGLHDSQSAADALRRDGVAGLLEIAQERTRNNAEETLEVIAAISESSGVPVVLVVPEVNLTDWQRRRPVGWLSGNDTQRWHDLRTEAADLLQQGAAEAAALRAETMIELDGGTCPTSHEILARARLLQGKSDEAREAFQAAVDCRVWDNFPSMPSATTAVQEAMRFAAQRHEFALVDLPDVFARYTNSQLPGRALFLDYCHLTLQGMKVAMAAVTAEVLEISDADGFGETDWVSLVDRFAEPSVSAESDALVKFMTALYNAHYGADFKDTTPDKPSAAMHWLTESRNAWDGIEQTMLAYVATRGVRAESLRFSVELRRFYESISSLERQSAYHQCLDPDVVHAIGRVLEDPDYEIPEAIDARLPAERLTSGETVDLSRPEYHWRVDDRYQDAGGFANDAKLPYRARWPVSDFCLPTDGVADLCLTLVARRPISDEVGDVTVSVNGTMVGLLRLGREWARTTLPIAGETLQRGFNKVSLHWPALPSDGDRIRNEIIERLSSGIPVDLHPVFGEVFSLTVRVAAPDAAHSVVDTAQGYG